MARFLDLIQASRVHSWMRCFGHALPKPSGFMSNIKDEIVGPLLRRQWSAKMEELWQKILGAKLMSVLAIRKLWINKSKRWKTALKFHWNRKIKLAKYEKCFYRIHRSKSNNRKFVSGGKHLKDSGIYTPGFCQVVFDVWQTAYNSNSREFTWEDLSLENLWRDTFAASSREEDQLWQKMF